MTWQLPDDGKFRKPGKRWKRVLEAYFPGCTEKCKGTYCTKTCNQWANCSSRFCGPTGWAIFRFNRRAWREGSGREFERTLRRARFTFLFSGWVGRCLQAFGWLLHFHSGWRLGAGFY
jgi:hypothetical protein